MSNTTFVQVKPLDSDRQKLNLRQDEWHFISVTVINTDLVYFIDGEFMRGAKLTAAIQDSGGVVYIGRKDQCKFKYKFTFVVIKFFFHFDFAYIISLNYICLEFLYLEIMIIIIYNIRY